MQARNTGDLEQALSACEQVEQYLEDNSEHLQELPLSKHLAKLMEERGLTKSHVIAASNLNDIYAYQIFSGTRAPSRDKLLCLCFGMGLSAEETQNLLKWCGYPVLYAKKRRDSVILHALYHNASLMECNEQLYNMDEELLN